MGSINPDFNNKLRDALLEILALQDMANRTVLLQGLSGPVATISRHGAAYTDLSNIVNTVSSWKRLSESNEYALATVIRNALSFVRGTELESDLQDLLDELDGGPELYILHLSDIHLGTQAEALKYRSQLVTDLKEGLQVTKLDYLIISGDIAHYSTPDEYGAASSLINGIKELFYLDAQHLIIAPGNHDLNWDLSRAAYIPIELEPTPPSPLPDEYIPDDEGGALKRDENEYRQRFLNFRSFYEEVCGESYPLDFADQAILYPFPDHRILFLGLNSCWEIDHYYRRRAGVNMMAISAVLERLPFSGYANWLKIATWHHPVTGPEMMNDDFLQLLSMHQFQICMHGHIHRAQKKFYEYDSFHGLHIVGAGTFGAPVREQVPSIPLQYNLLILKPQTRILTVESRKREDPNGAWSADARWGDIVHDPEPRYTIRLKDWTFT